MNPQSPTLTPARWPRIWRLTMIGLGVLILCSCKGPAARYDTSAIQGRGYSGLPANAYTVCADVPPGPPAGPPGMEQGVPLPYQPVAPWTPPGIAGPWPQDEYMCDGNDAGLPAQVGNQREVRGLDMEDAVAHFDTLDGRTVVQPSNRVCLYAPRFAAVRQVVNSRVNQQEEQAVGVHLPVKAYAPRETTPVASAKQNLQAGDEVGRRPAEALRTRWGDGALSSRVPAMTFINDFKAYENFTAIRTGVMIESETAFLARSATAAVSWNKTQAVQVILDRTAATAETGANKPELVFTDVAAPAHPRLRVIKVASTPFAEPGDEVWFTLRFDNVGNQPIRKVTILDSLNTRLQFDPRNAQCSRRDALISSSPNEGDSVVVRCELVDPLLPGEGGVLRFRCTVR